MKSKIATYSIALEFYTAQQIDKAFKIWVSEKNKMPFPSDIKDIIVAAMPPAPYAPPKGVEGPKYHDLTPEQQKKFDESMAEFKKNLGETEEVKADRLARTTKIDTSHFNRHSEKQKTEINQNFIKSAQELKNGFRFY
jgi:hypothetical protein